MVLRFCVAFLGDFLSTGSFCWCLLVIWISAVWDFFSRRVSYTFLNSSTFAFYATQNIMMIRQPLGKLGKQKRSFHQNWRLDGQGLPLQPTIPYGSFLRQKGLVQQGRGHCTTTSCGFLFFSHMELEWEGNYLHTLNGHEDIIIIRDLTGKQKRMGTLGQRIKSAERPWCAMRA